MQDRYAGDLGDYAKCGLVRALCDGELPLGLVWYRVPDEAHNADGRHIDYLKPGHRQRDALAACDPVLHAAFRAMVFDRRQRSVAALERLAIWPTGTRFYRDLLSFEGVRPDARPAARRAWLDEALAATEGAAVVCVDADNGLETASSRRHGLKGGKHAFLDELQRFWQRGQSLIVYQHTHRRGTVAEQVARRLPQLRDGFVGAASIDAVRFRRGTSRVFFIIAQAAHDDLLRRRLDAMLRGPWAAHFQRV